MSIHMLIYVSLMDLNSNGPFSCSHELILLTKKIQLNLLTWEGGRPSVLQHYSLQPPYPLHSCAASL